MGRPSNPLFPYTIKPHKLNGHIYASTQVPRVDGKTGRKVFRHVHWGTLTDNVFHPFSEFILLPPSEREKYIFPEGCDTHELQGLSGMRGPGRPEYCDEAKNRLYGDIWLLEQVAEKTGVRQDLMVAFDGNKEMADAILTLAMFPYVTKFNYSRVERWQRIARTPSSMELSAKNITLLTQSITEGHRMAFLQCRASRLRGGQMCAVDSTTRTAYGDSLTDIRWGRNKERLPMPHTTEVVVYTLDSHMPLYYRSFPGNMPDSRSLPTILADLEHAGFTGIIFITDRGYESLRNLEGCILKHIPFVSAVKIQQDFISEKILEFGDFGARPDGMELDPDTRLYHRQYDMRHDVKGNGNCVHKSDRLKLNLFFDSARRGEEMVELDIEILKQETDLAAMKASGELLDADAVLKRQFCYFSLEYDAQKRILTGYSRDEKKIERARRYSGFFAILTHCLDWDAPTAYGNYRLRDEQEKYFQQMKDQMGADRQRNWSEDGKTGRLFILFVALILSSHVRHVWRSTALHKSFRTSLDILDEMRSIRCVEHTNRAKHVTPFVGMQNDICDAFGFTPPKGCERRYVSREVVKRKRGRPRKAVVEQQ